MIIAQNKLATTTFQPESKILVSVYKGKMSVDLVTEHVSNIANFYKTNEVFGSVVDVSKVYGSFNNVLDYVRGKFPDAAKSGLRYLAYVISDDLIIENLSTQLKYMATEQKIVANVFMDRDEAINWVTENLNNK